MITKNHSRFTTTHITLSRKDYDVLCKKNRAFLYRLFSNYRRSWSLAGVTFYELCDNDYKALYKLISNS